VKAVIEHLSIPREGETWNGDAVVVRPYERGTMFAVVDALGHGEHAAVVAKMATECLEQAPLEGGVRELVETLHRKLRGSRGAAAMLCLFEDGRLEGCGVGNVELRSIRTRVPVVLSPGILGGTINRIRIFEAQLSPGDRLVLFSDGISSRIDLDACRGISAAQACRTLMERHRRSHDDATVLITDIEA